MAYKTKRKNAKRDTWIVIGFAIVVILIIAGILLWFFLKKDPAPLSPTEITEEVEKAIPEMPFEVPGFTMLAEAPCGEMNDSLYVSCMGTYTGAFVEDGTDEQVENVLALVVKNTGEELVEYGKITADYDGEPVTFNFSGLPASGYVLVMEENRTVCEEPEELSDLACAQMAMPVDIILDFDTDFTLYPSDGVINLENISGRDFESDISVFYKNFEYGLFIGGITYRARFSGGVKDGAYAQSMQEHYTLEKSAILYMSYER